LLEGVENSAEVRAIAERIGAALQEPLTVDGQQVEVGASIGIAVSGPGSDHPSDLLRKADLAMYRAKGLGKGGHTIFDDALDVTTLATLLAA